MGKPSSINDRFSCARLKSSSMCFCLGIVKLYCLFSLSKLSSTSSANASLNLSASIGTLVARTMMSRRSFHRKTSCSAFFRMGKRPAIFPARYFSGLNSFNVVNFWLLRWLVSSGSRIWSSSKALSLKSLKSLLSSLPLASTASILIVLLYCLPRYTSILKLLPSRL